MRTQKSRLERERSMVVSYGNLEGVVAIKK
jgi:hypothetical protein